MTGKPKQTSDPPHAQTENSPVVRMLRKYGISSIPRNYELCYEAVHGNQSQLLSELISLGRAANQGQLDQLYATYIGPIRHDPRLERVQTKLSDQLDGLLALLAKERETLENHGSALSKAHQQLSSADCPVEQVRETVGDLHTSTRDTLASHANITQTASSVSGDLQSLKQELKAYRRLVKIDALTGLNNRRAFDEHLIEVCENTRSPEETSLVLLDIDHFKSFNDRFGHPTGDKILQTLGKLLGGYVSRNIFVARGGGEEFAVLTTGLKLEETLRFAEKVRHAVENGFRGKENVPALTVSMGVATLGGNRAAADIYEHADFALYRAKEEGRNRICLYDETSAGSSKKGWLLYKGEPTSR